MLGVLDGDGAGFFAPGFGAADFAAGLSAFSSALPAEGGGFSLILRTTGASMVELAVLTNSPCSFRYARSSLLSIPSSLASS